MKKRLIALLLVIALLIPAGFASAASMRRVNTTSVKVRLMPSESARVLGSYRKDYACTVTSTKDGWSYVKFSNGFEGYVQSKYLSKASSYSAWVAYDDTSLRKGPDGSFAAISTLARGVKVSVLSHGSKYDYVSAGDYGKGYIVNSRLSKKKVARSGAESTTTILNPATGNAWVNAPGYSTVNFRSGMSTSAPIIARYPTGTPVTLLEQGSSWSKVKINGREGYMMTRFLSSSAPAPTPTAAPTGNPQNNSYTAYVKTDNGKQLNVRKGPSTHYSVQFKIPYGAPVAVLEHGATWDYVKYNGRKGYAMTKYLQLQKPADAPAITTLDPNATPAPQPTFSPYNTTVKVDNLNFHKQKGDWSSNVYGVGRLNAGDPVTVLKIDGGWAKVQYGSYTGWVHKEFLN